MSEKEAIQIRKNQTLNEIRKLKLPKPIGNLMWIENDYIQSLTYSDCLEKLNSIFTRMELDINIIKNNFKSKNNGKNRNFKKNN